MLIDADDTLWENNIYFERAIANFISFLNHHEYSPEQVRGVLNDVERECIVTHGYGLHSFSHALVRTFERLAVEPLTPALHETISGFAHTIAEHLASKKVSPKGPASGMRMLNFYINRAGKNLSAARHKELEHAKELLSEIIRKQKEDASPKSASNKTAKKSSRTHKHAA